MMPYPLLDTYYLEQKTRKKVEEAFGLKFEETSYDPRGPIGHCYWNVRETVAQMGGRAVYGWLILTWPKLYVQAMHHGVWQRPDGQLVDVTQKYPTDQRRYSVFARDEAIEPDLDRPIFIDNKYYVLRQCKEVRNLIANSRLQLTYNRQVTDAAAAIGINFQPGVGLDISSAPPSSEVRRLAEQWKSHADVVDASINACARLSPAKHKWK